MLHMYTPTHPHTHTPTHPHTLTPTHPHTHTPTHPQWYYRVWSICSSKASLSSGPWNNPLWQNQPGGTQYCTRSEFRMGTRLESHVTSTTPTTELERTSHRSMLQLAAGNVYALQLALFLLFLSSVYVSFYAKVERIWLTTRMFQRKQLKGRSRC